MRHKLLTKSWLAGHAFVVLAVAAFCLLGWWQWERAHEASGGMQNFGYALQWPAFAIMLLAVWVKSMRDELKPGSKEGDQRRALSRRETQPSSGISLASRQHPASYADEDDEELAAYNRYLSQVNAAHGRYPR